MQTLQANDKSRGSFLQLLTDRLQLKPSDDFITWPWGRSLVFTSSNSSPHRYYCFFLKGLKEVDQTFFSLFKEALPGDHIFVALAPVEKSGLLPRMFQWKKIRRNLESMGYSVTKFLAVDPSPWETHILFDLQRNILAYVELESIRFLDGPIRHLAKRFAMHVAGVYLWQGWMVAALSTNGNNFILPEITDRYLILTTDRTISLVFEKGSDTPAFVEKKGPADSLQCEWENHKWARELLGNSVPDVFDFASSFEVACLKIEYIPERNMINIVAQSLFRKVKLKTETLAVLDFFRFAFDRFVGNESIQKQPLPETIREAAQEGLNYLYESANGDPLALELQNSLRQMDIPLIPQHGDFCVRNILYRNSGEKVLIDWEDFKPIMLPCVDLNMLQVSLAESWAGLFGGDVSSYHQMPTIKLKLADFEDSMRNRLNLNENEWRICSLLSLAYLAGINISKGRGVIAAIIKKEYRRKVN